MPQAAQLFAPVWPALPLVGPLAAVPPVSPAEVGPSWHQLGQHWRPAAEPGLNSGWARIHWNDTGLLYEAVFLQRRPANRARRLNERTWELGDIAEFFLQDPATGRYLELHVTPENQRLQLLWPLGGLERFRAGTAPLDDFLIPDSRWVESHTGVTAGHWTARAFIPYSCLGLERPPCPPVLRTAVCRYDRSRGPELFSSTARLTEPNYHRHQEWAELRLLPPA
ncbi:MAG: hypothetical protein SGI90_12020 [Candidatus Eisenbacteria bacterium]|nr:hypothetical protein [Candidatus Eisenbacteria bacterium]